MKPFIDQTIRFKFLSIGGEVINLSSIISVITFFVLVQIYLIMKIKDKKKIYANRIIWTFIIFNVLMALFSILNNQRKLVNVVEILIRYSTPYFFYFTFSIFLEDISFKNKLVKSVWLSNLGACLLTILFWISGIGFEDISQNVNRFSGLYGDAASFSLVAFTSLAFGILYYKLQKKKVTIFLKYCYYFTFPIFVLVFWITLTKATFIITFIFILLWWGFYKRKKIIVIPFVLLSILFIFNESQKVQERFGKELTFIKEMNTNEFSTAQLRGMGSGRFGRWMDAWDIFQNEYSTFEKLFGTYQTYRSHNQFIGYLTQIGILGLAMFLVIMYLLIRKMWKRNRISRDPTYFMGLVLLISILLYGIGYMSFGYTSILWVTMILVTQINVPINRQINDYDQVKK